MRVISGKYKGRNIKGFNINGTRPTMDRVKESVFGMIQDRIKGSACLDLFAGSGSLGIEALSNGAFCCYFVENGNDIYNFLRDNLNGISDSYLLKKDYRIALADFKKSGLVFDVIFLDPPYKMNLINDILVYIYENDLLSENGVIVCEFETEEVSTDFYELYKFKKYGDKKVNIYKKL